MDNLVDSPNTVLGIDLDGVLGNLAESLIEIAHKKYQIDIDVESITCYQLEKCTVLTIDQINEIFRSTSVFQDMKPIIKAREVLGRLKTKGWKIHIITDRFWGNQDRIIAKTWLEKNGFVWDILSLVRARDKMDFAKKHNISYFIEDNYDTVKDLAGICKKVFLLNKSYNQGPEIENVVRVATWEEIERLMGIE